MPRDICTERKMVDHLLIEDMFQQSGVAMEMKLTNLPRSVVEAEDPRLAPTLTLTSTCEAKEGGTRLIGANYIPTFIIRCLTIDMNVLQFSQPKPNERGTGGRAL
jgi:hypothetical protein